MKQKPIDNVGGSKRKVCVSLSPDIINQVNAFVHPDPAIKFNGFSGKCEFFLRKSVGTMPTNEKVKK
jgi:hypothetical protein